MRSLKSKNLKYEVSKNHKMHIIMFVDTLGRGNKVQSRIVEGFYRWKLLSGNLCVFIRPNQVDEELL
jgi:hypothetical protein